MAMEQRKYLDCRDFPSESNCSLYIAGKPDEVLATATDHAIKVHKHENTPELRSMLQSAMKDEKQPATL